MKKFASLFIATLLLTSCAQVNDDAMSNSPVQATGSDNAAASAPEPTVKALDLTGKWKQSNSNSDEDFMVAEIKNGVISVDWNLESEDMKAVYWIGSYEAPKGGENSYSWTSKRDKDKTESALLAAGSDTKEFTHEGDVISFEVSIQGTTKTIKMERAKG